MLALPDLIMILTIMLMITLIMRGPEDCAAVGVRLHDALARQAPLDEDAKTAEFLRSLNVVFKGGSAPAADPQVGAAALKEAQTGEAWLAFAKDSFATSTERQKDIDALTTEVTKQQLDTSKQQSQWATEDRARYDEKYRPIEDQFLDKVSTYGSKENQDAAAATAAADVQSAAASERATSGRQMAAVGISPTSGRYAGVDRAGELGTALATAGAKNAARQQVKDKALALEGSTVGLGNTAAALAGNGASGSVASGSAAVGTTSQGNANYLGSLGIMDKGFAGAMQGYGQQASILNNQYANQLNAYKLDMQSDAATWGGVGNLVGLGLSFLSDEDAKTDKQPVDGALDAIKDMPVEKWTYKEGQGDGGTHVGPYAQDMKRATGLGDGRSIGVQDAVGITMRAIQELDQKVEQISHAVGLGRKPAAAPAMKKAA